MTQAREILGFEKPVGQSDSDYIAWADRVKKSRPKGLRQIEDLKASNLAAAESGQIKLLVQPGGSPATRHFFENLRFDNTVLNVTHSSRSSFSIL